MSQHDRHDQAENPYASPETPSLVSGLTASELTESQLLRSFVGTNADYYLEKWGATLRRPNASPGFNWSACLLSGFWLPYRKMYKASFIFLGILILESFLEDVVFIGILGEVETPAVLERFVGILAAVICGAFGNRWYLSHARRVTADCRATGLQGEALQRLLAQRGGTSLAAVVGVFALFVAVSLAAFFALDPLLYSE